MESISINFKFNQQKIEPILISLHDKFNEIKPNIINKTKCKNYYDLIFNGIVLDQTKTATYYGIIDKSVISIIENDNKLNLNLEIRNLINNSISLSGLDHIIASVSNSGLSNLTSFLPIFNSDNQYSSENIINLSVESVDSIESVDSTDSIDSIESVESIESIESLDTNNEYNISDDEYSNDELTYDNINQSNNNYNTILREMGYIDDNLNNMALNINNFSINETIDWLEQFR
jgi:hypothetical protein